MAATSTVVPPPRAVARRERRVLPGLPLTLGFALVYLSLLVLVPLGAVVLEASELTWEAFWAAVSSKRAVASYMLSFGAALAAAGINAVFGTLLGWVLVRYSFPGKRLIDSLVDLPFALPTAVAGIALTATWAPNGPMGGFFASLGIATAYSRIGIVIALVFVSLPFMVRTIQPVLETLDVALEEASASLGATRWQTFRHVVVPHLRPALVTGFSLSFARALGEYGSVVFISGNMPMRTEITPLLIMTQLEQFNYPAATALAVVMLIVSFAILLFVNGLQWRRARRTAAARPEPARKL